METIGKNLEMLTAFQAVAEAKSFTLAAERLGKSKSFLSKQIMTLEAYLGTTLFLRTTRSFSLTHEGAVLREYTDRIFKLSFDAERHLKEFGHGISGTIRISTPLSLGLRFFPAFLREAAKGLPRVTFDCDLSNENRDFGEDQIDFAIRATEDHSKDLEVHSLGRIRDVICATPAIASAYRGVSDPERLRGAPFIHYSHDPSWNVWHLRQGAKRGLTFEGEGKYFVGMYEAARSLCVGGLGIARLPRYAVEDELAKKTLIALLPEFELSSQPLSLVYPKRGYTSKMQTLAKELILKWFKSKRELFV
jgi:DNA-binding transcriptional LysR family regulator